MDGVTHVLPDIWLRLLNCSGLLLLEINDDISFLFRLVKVIDL